MNPMREQIRSMLRVEPRPGGFRALLSIDPKLSVLPDHFPDHPIFPGICMVQAVLLSGAAQMGVCDLSVRTLKNAKMLQPVRPGQQVVIDADLTPANDGDFLIKAKLFVEDRRCAEFSLVVYTVAALEGACP
jgi:3-hydroxyacyl-[acyl-carrier-protein] dehydratase